MLQSEPHQYLEQFFFSTINLRPLLYFLQLFIPFFPTMLFCRYHEGHKFIVFFYSIIDLFSFLLYPVLWPIFQHFFDNTLR